MGYSQKLKLCQYSTYVRHRAERAMSFVFDFRSADCNPLLFRKGWKVEVDASEEGIMQTVRFEKAGRRHALTLRITDVAASPKPVDVSWE